MATSSRHDLEMDDDMQQQEREWVMQRITWILLATLLLAVGFGLFGRGGRTSKISAFSNLKDGAVRFEHNRFLRYHSSDMLQVSMRAKFDSVRLTINNRYAEQTQIERITSQPVRGFSNGDAITSFFNAQPLHDLHATFLFAPQEYGKLEGWIAEENGPMLIFEQFVYP